jgi:adenine-specific DNA-methyltransferase
MGRQKRGNILHHPLILIHIHESIKPHKIIRSVQTMGDDYHDEQGWLFESDTERAKRRNDAIEFYQHKDKWTNRLIAGDSLVIMNSLLEKEGMAGQVQTVYIDPPYGIKYGSNFQPFVNKRDVKDKKDEDLSSEPEMIKAFRDTWELGIHSYLSYLRDRLLLAKELLVDTGNVFVQISDENVHHVREICDEVFGVENFVSQILFQTTGGFESSTLSRAGDLICWYAKNKKNLKYRALFERQDVSPGASLYNWIVQNDGFQRSLTKEERSEPSLIPEGAIVYKADNIKSQGASSTEQTFSYQGKTYYPGESSH